MKKQKHIFSSIKALLLQCKNTAFASQLRPFLFLMVATCVATGILFTSCHKDQDELFTTAEITIDAGDSVQVHKMEVAITLTNLNTNEVVNATEQQNTQLNIRCLQGIYKVFAQGTVTLTDQQGQQRIRRFRVYKDFLQITGLPTSKSSLPLFYID
jgi:lipoprotein